MRRFVCLVAAACAPVAPLTQTQQPPPAGETALAVTPLLPGEPLRLTATGVPPTQTVTWLRGTGTGSGTCFPGLGGACLNITDHVVLGRSTADSTGRATLDAVVPARVPVGRLAAFQAGWVSQGVLELTPSSTRITGRSDVDLQITEVVSQPTNAEFIEIYNPSSEPADLSRVWLADYADAVGLPLDQGAPSSSDFRIQFPADASLAPGAYATIALGPAADFISAWGTPPDFDLDPSDPQAPAMQGTFTGSSGLTNGDEMVWLFSWDGADDAVVDLDYLVYGDTSDAMDRTGLSVGQHTYEPDTPASLQRPGPAHAAGQSLSRCLNQEPGQRADGGNGWNGTDETSEDLALSWQTTPEPTPGSAASCGTITWPVTEVTDFSLPLTHSGQADTRSFTSASAFEDYFGSSPPASVDFGTETILYASLGPSLFPGSTVAVTDVTLDDTGWQLSVASTTPGSDCSTLEYAPAAWTMIKVPRATPHAPATSSTTTETTQPCVGGNAGGSDCSATDPCEPGTTCHGLTVFDFGFCRPDSDRGTFQGNGGAIPDNLTTGFVTTIDVTGLTSVPEDAILSVSIRHPDPSQLSVTLSNPLGTPSTLWDREQAPDADLRVTAPMFVPGDEDVNGTWTLTVVDHVRGETGLLERWQLELTSRFD